MIDYDKLLIEYRNAEEITMRANGEYVEVRKSEMLSLLELLRMFCDERKGKSS